MFHTLSFTHHLWHTIFHTTLSRTIFHTQLCHTLSFTHNFDTHYLSHTTLSHTIFDTWSFTHHFVTHHLSHTIFDTPSYTQLCHTPSFTHHLFHTPSLTHHLWHTIFHTTSPHTIFHTPSQTIFHTPLCHTPSLTHDLSHTTLSHTIFHTQSLTHHLTHTIFHHTIFHTHNFVTNHFSSTSSFVFPSPSPLQNLLIIIGRNWLVGLCGPLTFFSIRCSTRITDTQLSSMLQLEYFTRPFDVLHRSWTMLMLDKKTIAVCPFAATLIPEPQAF